MTDTLMSILGIALAVLVMFIIPTIAIAGEYDEIAQTTVEVAVADFVNTIAEKGKITEFDYNELIQKISATGNSFDVQIELQVMDDNPERKTVTTSQTLNEKGENLQYSVYTQDITDKIREKITNDEEGEYNLKKDDYIIVTVKNTNITIGTAFKNFFYRIVGKDAYVIGTSSSALVTNSGAEEIATGTSGEEAPKPDPISKTITLYIRNTKTVSSNIIFVIDVTGSMSSSADANGYSSRINMVKENVKDFLNSVELPETSSNANTRVDVIRFGTISEIMTGNGINTKSALSTFLSGTYNRNINASDGRFSAYENYDLGLEDALTCVRRNKTINSKKNLVIVITDGQSVYNSQYCISHNGNMSEYAQKLITQEGAIVYAVGVGKQTSTAVLNSMVLDPSKYVTKIYDTGTESQRLDSLLTEIKSEIISDEQRTVTSVDGKILLQDLTTISASNPLRITITGPITQEFVVTRETDSLLEKDGDGNFWLVLQSLALRVGGVEMLEDVNVGIHY